MSDQVTERFASLRDGRRLAYLATGPRDGMLVLYLHGAIGSPQGADADLEAATHDLGIHYVMVSRPGFGASDPAPGRTLADFACDAAALADELGRERFAVVGVSAGGPYALACAHELPERVAAAAVVSCMAPGCGTPAGLPLPVRLGLRALRARPRTCAHAGDALLAIAPPASARRGARHARRCRSGRPAAARRRRGRGAGGGALPRRGVRRRGRHDR